MNKNLLIAFALMQAELIAAPTFQEEILPIAQASCVSCHGAKGPYAGFQADILAEYWKNTENGPLVIAGDSDNSALISLLSEKSQIRNKRNKHSLPAEQLATIRKWIDSGAN